VGERETGWGGGGGRGGGGVGGGGGGRGGGEAGGEAGEELGEELEALGEQVILTATPGTSIKIHIHKMTVMGVLYRSYGNQSLVIIVIMP